LSRPLSCVCSLAASPDHRPTNTHAQRPSYCNHCYCSIQSCTAPHPRIHYAPRQQQQQQQQQSLQGCVALCRVRAMRGQSSIDGVYGPGTVGRTCVRACVLLILSTFGRRCIATALTTAIGSGIDHWLLQATIIRCETNSQLTVSCARALKLSLAFLVNVL